MTMIAYAGPDLPHDLLAATAGGAAPLAWNIDRPMPAGERWLESKFPLWAKSIVQDWADGAFDQLDAVLFSRSDDTAQRLYYYLVELRRQGQVGGPEPLVLDVAKVPRRSSVAHVAAGIRALAARLGVSAVALEGGIVATNAARATAPENAARGDKPVALLAGSAPPDRRLHRMIEGCGWAAAGETLREAWERLGDPVEERSDDPFAAVARQLHAGGHGARAFGDPDRHLLAEVARTGAKAVVLWFAEEEEAHVWHLPGHKRMLAEAGVPALAMTRRDWRAEDGAAGEIAAFLVELDR